MKKLNLHGNEQTSKIKSATFTVTNNRKKSKLRRTVITHTADQESLMARNLLP
jgi:hypothetical protein